MNKILVILVMRSSMLCQGGQLSRSMRKCDCQPRYQLPEELVLFGYVLVTVHATSSLIPQTQLSVTLAFRPRSLKLEVNLSTDPLKGIMSRFRGQPVYDDVRTRRGVER